MKIWHFLFFQKLSVQQLYHFVTYTVEQGSGTLLAEGAMKPTYFQLYFRESHTILPILSATNLLN